MSKFDAKDVADNKAVAALSYISILFLVPLLLKKDSPFAKAHAKQGLILFLFEVVVSFLPMLNMILWRLVTSPPMPLYSSPKRMPRWFVTLKEDPVS